MSVLCDSVVVGTYVDGGEEGRCVWLAKLVHET